MPISLESGTRELLCSFEGIILHCFFIFCASTLRFAHFMAQLPLSLLWIKIFLSSSSPKCVLGCEFVIQCWLYLHLGNIVYIFFRANIFGHGVQHIGVKEFHPLCRPCKNGDISSWGMCVTDKGEWVYSLYGYSYNEICGFYWAKERFPKAILMIVILLVKGPLLLVAPAVVRGLFHLDLSRCYI
jgi:hypothetical protein